MKTRSEILKELIGKDVIIYFGENESFSIWDFSKFTGPESIKLISRYIIVDVGSDMIKTKCLRYNLTKEPETVYFNIDYILSIHFDI